MSKKIIDEILRRLVAVRYVAIYRNDRLASKVRKGLANASASESDRYEELLVNPTLLKLVTQRGNIDCGGARFLLISYGNFYEFVRAIKGGHISVGIEPSADPLALVGPLESILRRRGLLDRKSKV